MSTRLTYIIPAFNAQATIDHTVRSVLSQTDPNVAALVVDDGSTDGTRHVVGGLLGPRVGLLSQENRGLAGARNAGWREVETEHVCFLDADDTVTPDHAARMLEGIGKADAIACSFSYVGPDLECLDWHSPVHLGDTGYDRLVELNRLAIGAMVFRRDLAKRCLGGHMFEESLPLAEDWEFTLRLARMGASWAAPVSDPLFMYRLRRTSMTMDLDRLYSVGLSLIDEFARDEQERARVRRAWAIRALARSIASEDADTVRDHLERLGGLVDSDMGVLIGAIRWSMARRDIVGPESWDARMPEWSARVARTMGPGSLTTRLIEGLSQGPHRWRRTLEVARARLVPNERLVIFGFGRNGQEAVRVAESLNLPFLVADDRPDVLAGRVDEAPPESLGPEHTVLVTPESRSGIIGRLRSQGVLRILEPGEIPTGEADAA